MIAPLADNIVRKWHGRLIADAESLLTIAARADLPVGLRIIDCAGGSLLGFSLGSGHGFAQAHGYRPGTVAVGVAAETILRRRLELYADELPVALGEAALLIEYVACHELAHAITHPIDGEVRPIEAKAYRLMREAVDELPPTPGMQTVDVHHAAWAAGLVVLARRCRQYRPQAKHRWDELLKDDLRAVGIDAQAVADAVGDVADELPLRDLLAPGAALVARVADAIPGKAERIALIESRDTTPADPGHVAQVAAGEPL